MLVRALSGGEFEATSSVLNRLYSCALCKACEVNCPSEVRVPDVMREVREVLVKEGKGPLDEQKEIVSAIKASGNIFNSPPILPDPIKELASTLPPQSENIFFIGCVALFGYPKFPEILMRCLMMAGYSFTILDRETCCGGPLKALGLKSEFVESAGHIVLKIRESRAKRIITICPMCYTVFKEVLTSTGLEVRHVIDILADLVKKGEIPLMRKVNLRLVCHDPCHLGRYSGIFDPVRDILRSIPGIKLKELESSRENSRCCGGPIRIPFTDIRNALCEEILRQASVAKVDGIVTACPTCFHNLNTVSIEHKIFDSSELVGFSAGLVEKIPVYKKF